MFEKVLIANRGEIALRVARACREMGVKSVAVYSTADAESAVVKFADEAVCIGPPPPGKSYLHIPNLIGAAQKTGADALHPGYGFLSEDPFFAEICNDNGIKFIGPDPEVMEKVGDKAIARDLMSKAGLPLLPGTVEPIQTVGEAQEFADSIGYPVIIKAVAGGGGRGMNVVHKSEDLARLYETTRNTAQAIFKDSAVYIERYLAVSRHTEVQLVCDSHGNGVYFFERDCSVQRRHQKLIEEAPSVHLSPGAAQGHRRARRGRCPLGRLHRRRHDGVPARPRGQSQLHGDERAHPGRAPRQRDGHAVGPDPGADPGGRGRAALGQPGRRRAARARDGVPHQRRGSGQQLRARRRPARHLRAAGRPRHARGLPLLSGLGDRAVLRLADRQAARLGTHPRRGDRPHGSGAVRVPDRRAGREDHDPVPPARAGTTRRSAPAT